MQKRFKPFTTAERRGLLAILLIMAIIVAVSYFSMSQPTTAGQSNLETDTILKHQISNLNDTIKDRQNKSTGKRHKKKNSKKHQPKMRDPLSQPVPQL